MKSIVSLLSIPSILFVVACGPQATDGPAPTTAVNSDCAIDDDCDNGYICEETICVAGDRDNDFETATPVFQNQDAVGIIFPEGDEDRYAYDSPGEEWLRISTIVDEELSFDTWVTVYSSNGAIHHEMDEMAMWSIVGFDTRMMVYLPTPGTWYIGVSDSASHYGESPRADETFEYTLVLESSTAVTVEPDSIDDPSASTDLDDADSIYSRGVLLAEPGDSDWLEITTPYPDASLLITGPYSTPGSDAEPLIRLHDPDLNIVLEMENIVEYGPAILMRQEEGDYLLEVTDARGGGSNSHWTVVYFRTFEDDGTNDHFSLDYEIELEPNDTQEDRNVPEIHDLTTSDDYDYEAIHVDGTLTEEGDEDWYQLPAHSSDYAHVFCWTSDYGSLADIAVDLVDPSGAIIHTVAPKDAAPPEETNLPVTDDGNHAVRVYSQSDTYGPGAWYRCRFWITDWQFQ